MTVVGPDSIRLLLRLLEGPARVYSRTALVEYHGDKGEKLIGSGLLHLSGYASTTDVADDDDLIVEVAYDRDRGEFGYHSPSQGWHPVDRKDLGLYRPDIAALLHTLLGGDPDLRTGTIVEIEPDLIWDVGDARLTRKVRSSVWFARRLGEPKVQQALRAAIERRPSANRRLVLTSTPNRQVQELSVPMTQIVPIEDVLSSTGLAIIDIAMLKIRFAGMSAAAPGDVLHLSDDGRVLTLRGHEQFHFRSDLQIEIIRKLVEAYKRGKWVVASELLEEAGSAAKDFSQAFGKQKWAKLTPYMRNEDGKWILDP